MNAKLSDLSELANILSVKSAVGSNIFSLFPRFGTGHLLCHMSLEKPRGMYDFDHRFMETEKWGKGKLRLKGCNKPS